MSRANAIAATVRLRACLDTVAGALAEPGPALLLSAEVELAAALTELETVRRIEPGDRVALLAAVADARATLSRCRILGAAAMDAARAVLVSQGRDELYGRSSATRPRGRFRGVDVSSRI